MLFSKNRNEKFSNNKNEVGINKEEQEQSLLMFHPLAYTSYCASNDNKCK